jgi:pimeloyl-ACP methyl ester carboxylesterase
MINKAFEQTISADSSYPPPGRLIDIGGRKLHLIANGNGSPTIVLEAGGGAYSIDWNLVQSKISGTTRVISYDRADLGWSDDGPADETVEQTVSDLHKLLQKAGEKGPYLLVGASIGGIFIQAYQHTYPNEVAGLIFSNSSNHVGLVTKNKTDLLWNLTEDEIRSNYPLSTSEKDPRPTNETDPFDRLPSSLQAMRLWLDVQSWKKWDPAKATAASMLSWRKEFIREFDETDFAKKPPLGKLPVIVISSDEAANDSVLHHRDGAAERLDFLSSNTIHITATNSGHEIHLYQPDRVVEALKIAVTAVRTNKPLKK